MDAGLLTNRTVVAHCVHLNSSELQMVMDSGATCSHCPCSNYQLGSGIAPVSWYKSKGYELLGLGTDVSGGYAVSMTGKPSILLAHSARRDNLRFLFAYIGNKPKKDNLKLRFIGIVHTLTGLLASQRS